MQEPTATIREVQPSGRPLVSVLMPTYRQGSFIARAIGSLLAQSLTDFELIIVDDGSPDNTAEIVQQFNDPRIRYVRNQQNLGLGAALNIATGLARGKFIGYLPSDDVMDRTHLEHTTGLLRDQPDIYLAYGGVRWVRRADDRLVALAKPSPTLHGDTFTPGNIPMPRDIRSGNFLALVQVVHRRDLEHQIRWTERTEKVSDSLELDFWTSLLAQGAQFQYVGQITTEWGDHPEQRHKIIAGRGTDSIDQREHGYGLSRYRQFYNLPSGQKLNWQPVDAEGWPIDEAKRYPDLNPQPNVIAGERGLRILVVGAEGYNIDHFQALTTAGHTVAGLWSAQPHFWENTGPLPFTGIEYIPNDERWRENVAAFQPDVAYGVLNWPNIPLMRQVQQSGLAPFFVHLKESPMAAMQVGTWPDLVSLMQESAGRIYISPESEQWWRTNLGPTYPEGPSLLMDGDLPYGAISLTDEWSPPVETGNPLDVHTVCVGRVMLEAMPELAQNHIHLHLYGPAYRSRIKTWLQNADESPYLHLHDQVEPQAFVRELSQYDGGWLHIFNSYNNGDIRVATWSDLNMPARMNVYAIAGLPWIMKRNAGHVVGTNALADQLGVGLSYDSVEELAAQLREERRTRQRQQRMRAVREQFTFDHHVPRLIEFFRQAALSK